MQTRGRQQTLVFYTVHWDWLTPSVVSVGWWGRNRTPVHSLETHTTTHPTSSQSVAFFLLQGRSRVSMCACVCVRAESIPSLTCLMCALGCRSHTDFCAEPTLPHRLLNITLYCSASDPRAAGEQLRSACLCAMTCCENAEHHVCMHLQRISRFSICVCFILHCKSASEALLKWHLHRCLILLSSGINAFTQQLQL